MVSHARSGYGDGFRDRSWARPSHQAFRLLQLGFVLLPLAAGLDKFFGVLTNWQKYLSPAISAKLPLAPGRFMQLVGVVEVAAGVLVAVRPRIGAYVVAAWLGLIIANLLQLHHYYDVAARDVGLLLAALALGRLSSAYRRD